MTDLQASAQTILDQLHASQQLTVGAVYYAGNGGIIAPDTMQDAAITETMRADYNADVQAVINATYYDAEMLFLDKHEAAMTNLDSAVDQLVAATAVLMEVQTVMNMAAQADTVQEQMAFQTVLANNDMTISTADTAAYNSALTAVQSYAREAGAFLAASRTGFVTSTTDQYAAQAGTSLYGANVAYSATADIINISAGSAFGIGFQGFLSSNAVTLDQVYNAGYGS